MNSNHQTNPPISIVIPCYNHGQFLLEAIASVENEPFINAEIIIVNDGSTASTTLKILKELEANNYQVFNIQNRGLSGARNFGIEQAKYPYILPLDADNKLEPSFLVDAISVLEEQPKVGVVYGDRCVFGQQEQRVEMAEFSIGRLLLGNYIDACALFRRQVWEEVGGYDSDIPDQLGYEDWDFWLGAAEARWKFAYVNKVAFRYRSRPDSMVSGCNLPANRKRLFQYICSKHYKLYSAQFPEVFATKEAQRLEALDEAFLYSEQVSITKAELAIAQQEKNQVSEKNQVLEQRIKDIELQLSHAQRWKEQAEIYQSRQQEAIAQSRYWEQEHGKVLNELNRLRNLHYELLNNRWWRLKAKVGRLLKGLMGR